MKPCHRCHAAPTFKREPGAITLGCPCDSVDLRFKGRELTELNLSEKDLENVLMRAWAEKQERVGIP